MSTTGSCLGVLDFGRAQRDDMGPKPVWFAVFPEGSVAADGWAQPLTQDADPASARIFGWHFAPFEPGPAFLATWTAIHIPTTPDGVRAFAERYAQDEHRADILRLMRAQVAAWHGVLPSDDAEQRFIRGRVWFREVPGRTEADLAPEARATLAAVDELLASSPGAKGAPR